MKKAKFISTAIFAYCILHTAYCFPQGTAINSSGAAAESSAILDVSSTTQGQLMPRMTTQERNAIANPVNGLMVFNNDCGNINYYFNGTWYPLNNGVSDIPSAAGTITGTSSVCQGQAGVQYSAGTIGNATDYLWYYTGAGATISGNTSPVTIDFSASATAGSLTVTGSNACGKGTASANYPITVNPAVAAGVSIMASPSGSVCSGTNVTYTATPVNGGASPSYQWKVNGADAGTNNSVFIYPPSDNDAVSCVMTSNASCVSGSPATSNIITATVNTAPAITGTTPGSRTGAGSVALGASASAGTINWYAAASGGSSLGTGTTFNTPAICITTTYYVDATLSGCTTPSRTAVTATINKSFQVDNGCSLTSGLLSYWRMYGNADDFFGSNNGTGNNITYSQGNGKVNEGAGFNGSSGSISLNQATSPFNGLSAGSLSMWVYFNSVSDAPLHVRQHDGNNTYAVFFVGFSTTTGGTYQAGTPGKIYVRMSNGQPLASSNANLSTGTWYNLTFLFNGSSLSIYINGALDSAFSGNYSIPSDGSCTNDTFGYWSHGYYLNGRTDEVGLWNKILSAQEISDIYNSGIGQSMQ